MSALPSLSPLDTVNDGESSAPFVYAPAPKPKLSQAGYTFQCPRCKRWFATAFNKRQHFFCVTEHERARLVDRARANQERLWRARLMQSSAPVAVTLESDDSLVPPVTHEPAHLPLPLLKID